MKTTVVHLCKQALMLVLCACPLGLGPAFASEQNAADVLKLYTRHQNDISRVYLEYECFVEYVGKYSRADFKQLDNVPIRRFYAGTLAYDGNRCAVRQEGWGTQNPLGTTLAKEEAFYESFLWTSDTFSQYQRGKKDAGLVWLGKDKEQIDKMKSLPLGRYTGKFLLGYPSTSLSTDRIDVILRKASQTSLKKDTELIGNSPCLVVEAETDIGSVTVWFDPKRQYGMSQLKIAAQDGHLRGGEAMQKDFTAETKWTILEYESVKGLSVPTKCEFHAENKYPNGDWTRFKSEFLAKRITLNPDFDKLDLFNQTDIRDGADLRILGRPDAKSRWKNEGRR
jgi:hypothetical protein